MDKQKIPYSTQLCVAALFTLAAAAHATYFDLGRIILQPSDEVDYMQRGLHAMGAQWNIYSFPLHSLTYAFTSFLEGDPIRNFELNGVVPFFLVAFLLQALVIRHAQRSLVAIVLCAPLLLSTKIGMLAWPHPNQTACILVLAGLLLMPRVPSPGQTAAHFTALTFVAAFARSEFALALYAVLAVTLTFVGTRCIRSPKERYGLLSGILLPTVIVIVGLTLALGRPILLDRYRSWAAFTQHFSYGLSLRTHLDQNPWTQNDQIAAQYFGKATTIGQAIVANPSAFFGHIWYNFRQLIDWLLGSDAPAAAGMAIVVILYALSLLKHGRSFIHSLRSGRMPAGRYRKLLILLLPLPSLLLITLIFPRPNYLQLVYVVTAASVAAAEGAGWNRLWRNRIPNFNAAAWALSLGTLVVGLVRPVSAQPDPVLSVVRIINSTVEYADASATATLYSNVDGICTFVRRQCVQHSLEDLADRQSPAQMTGEKALLFLAVNDTELRFVQDKTLQALRSIETDPQKYGWQKANNSPESWHFYRMADRIFGDK